MTIPTGGFVEILQSDLDAFAAQLEAVKTAIVDEINAIKAQVPPEANTAGLLQAISDLQSLVVPTPPLSA